MGTVVVIQKVGVGSLPPEEKSFGEEMLDRFLHTMEPASLRPEVICFYTDGVRAVCQGSPVLLGLQMLAASGVRLMVCRTCLEHFGLQDSLAIGEIVTMKDIVASLNSASRVVYP